MSVVALLSAKGSPGVTTAATVLAAVWPRPAVLADCDPAGGDLVYRLPAAGGGPLRPDVGVVSLVAAGPGSATGELAGHLQLVAGGLPVLVGVPGPAQAAALRDGWGRLAAALSGCDADVLADCGRWAPGSAASPVLAEAGLLLVVARAEPAGLARSRLLIEQLAAGADRLGPVAGRLGVVLVAPASRVGDARLVLSEHAPVWGRLAVDERGAEAMAGRPARRAGRGPLVASARLLAHQLDGRLARPAPRPVPVEAGPAVDRPVAGPAAWSGAVG